MRQTVAIAPTYASRVRIEEIVSEMSAELDEIARVLTDAIHEHLDELDEDLEVATLQSVRSNLGLLMTMLREGTEPAKAVAPPEALAYAKQYVRRGLSFELLQRAYRTAQGTFSRMWIERLRLTTDDPDLFAESLGFFNDWLFAWIEALERQLTGVYMRERESWVRGTAAMRAEQVRALLDGGRVDVPEASQRLRYELDRVHVAFVVWGDDGAADASDGHGIFGDMERVATAVAEAVGAPGPLTVPLGRYLACWAGVRDAASLRDLPDRLDTAADATLRVALGQPGQGVDGFRRSHREAVLARRAAKLLGLGRDGWVRFSDVGLDALLTQDADEARRFVERELGPLAEDGDAARRLLATLRVFLEEGASFVRAARRLGVHENTVTYRVHRAEELLGRRVTDRQLELHVALRLARLVLP